LLELDVTLGVNVVTVAVGLPGPIREQRMIVSSPHVQDAARRNVTASLGCEKQLTVASVALRNDPRHLVILA
jgi:hypothetical protein